MSVRLCPQCGAPLEASRFARQTVCKFCNAQVTLDPSVVSAAKYRAALASWNDAAAHGLSDVWTVAGTGWRPRARLGEGDRFRIFIVDRARTPTERAVMRVAKDAADASTIERTWSALRKLRAHDDIGDDAIRLFTPHPLGRGPIEGGAHRGMPAMIVRFRGRFRYTLADARRAFPDGVDPHIGLWSWRRVLESLALLHRAGFAHGAVLPSHVLLAEEDHGAILVGFSYFTAFGQKRTALPVIQQAFETKLPALASPELDIVMSARAIAFALGGDASGRVPVAVPRPFAEKIGRIAAGKFSAGEVDAWALRESLGDVAKASFGPPSFNPLRMPK